MAWTSILYVFKSVLTSAKMTSNQANFTAVAQGLSGAPKILDAAFNAGAITKGKIASGGTWANAEIANLPTLGTNPSPARQVAIVNAEIDPSAAITESRLNMDISTLALRDGSARFAIATGSTNAIVATYSPAFPSKANDLPLAIRVLTTNTTVVTLNVNGTGISDVQKWVRGALVNTVAGDVIGGRTHHFHYDGNTGKYVLDDPSQITDAMLSTNVALRGGNIFNALQTINLSSDGSALVAQVGGFTRWILSAFGSEPKLRIRDSGGVERLNIDMSNGEMTLGKIPLLRLRTAADAAVFDSSDKMVDGVVPHGRMLTHRWKAGTNASEAMTGFTVANGDLVVIFGRSTGTTDNTGVFGQSISFSGVGGAWQPQPESSADHENNTNILQSPSGVLLVNSAGTLVLTSTITTGAGGVIGVNGFSAQHYVT